MTIQEKNNQALAAFTAKDHTYLHLAGKGADQHLVAKEIGWFGRIILWICVKFGCSSARLDKIAKYIVEQMNVSKLTMPQNTKEKLKKKFTHYNQRHPNALKTEVDAIDKTVALSILNPQKPPIKTQVPPANTPPAAAKTPAANAKPNTPPAKIVNPTQKDLDKIISDIGFTVGPNNVLLPKAPIKKPTDKPVIIPDANPTPNTKPLINDKVVDPNEPSQEELLAIFSRPTSTKPRPTPKPPVAAKPKEPTKTPTPIAPQAVPVANVVTAPPVNPKVQDFIDTRKDVESAKKVIVDLLKDYIDDYKKLSTDSSLKISVGEKEKTFKSILSEMTEEEIVIFAKAKGDPLFYGDNYVVSSTVQDLRLGLIYEAFEMGSEKFNAFIQAKIVNVESKPMLKRLIFFFGKMDQNLRIIGFQSLIDLLDQKMGAYFNALPGFIPKTDIDDSQHPVNGFALAYLKHILSDTDRLTLFGTKCPSLLKAVSKSLEQSEKQTLKTWRDSKSEHQKILKDVDLG